MYVLCISATIFQSCFMSIIWLCQLLRLKPRQDADVPSESVHLPPAPPARQRETYPL